jgi:hypothetical protein
MDTEGRLRYNTFRLLHAYAYMYPTCPNAWHDPQMRSADRQRIFEGHAPRGTPLRAGQKHRPPSARAYAPRNRVAAWGIRGNITGGQSRTSGMRCADSKRPVVRRVHVTRGVAVLTNPPGATQRHMRRAAARRTISQFKFGASPFRKSQKMSDVFDHPNRTAAAGAPLGRERRQGLR